MKKLIPILTVAFFTATLAFARKFDPIVIGPPTSGDCVTSNQVDEITRYIVNDYVDNGGIWRDGKNYKLVIEPLLSDECVFYYTSGEIVRTNLIDSILRTNMPVSANTELYRVDIGYNVKWIESGCFYNCSNLTTVVMHHGIEVIEQYAFQGCEKLREVKCYGKKGSDDIRELESRDESEYGSIVLPISLEWVGNYSFSGCKSLTGKLVIPPFVEYEDYYGHIQHTYYGDNVFEYCTGLTSVEFPTNMSYIPDSMFYECAGLTGIIVFPNGVTSIGEDAFDSCINITGLSFPSTLEKIEGGAFSSCKGIKSLIFPSSLKTIGYATFIDCTGLNGQLIIPNSVTNIGAWAFDSCTSLKDLKINKHSTDIKKIGMNAFQNCTSLTNATLSDDILVITNSLFRNCKNLETVTYPVDLTEVCSSAFTNCYKLTGLTLPSSVTKIGDGAYGNCYALKSFTTPNSLLTIGKYAFANCSGIEDLNLRVPLNKIDNYAFSQCQGLTNVLFPTSLTTMGSRTFDTSTNILSVVFPEDCLLTTLGEYAFHNCKKLVHLELHEGLKTIGAYAFNGDNSLTNFVIPNSLESINNGGFWNCSKLTTLMFNDNPYDPHLKKINYAGFCSTGMTNIVFPDSVESLGQSAFETCSSLSNVVFGAGLKTLGDATFYKDTKLTNVFIPKSVQSIGMRTFGRCLSLTNIFVDEDSEYFTDIDGILYSHNTNTVYQSPCGKHLTSYTVPKEVEMFVNYAFDFNEYLETVDFESREELESTSCILGNFVFSECKKLKRFNSNTDNEAVIPKFIVDATGSPPFNRCPLIKTITSEEENAGYLRTSNGVLYKAEDTSNDILIRLIQYPTGKQDTTFTIPNTITNIVGFAFATNQNLKTVIFQPKDQEAEDHRLTLSSYAFYECKNLESVFFNDLVDEINDTAFGTCTSLKEITIPSKVKVIADGTFDYCIGLTNVIMHDNITRIGASSFKNCRSLKSTGIPENLSQNLNIAGSAYINCIGIESVTIPPTTLTVGESAFYGCTSLQSLTIKPPNSSLTIGTTAFASCPVLGPRVDINLKIQLGNNAFANCPSLTKLFFKDRQMKAVKNLSWYSWGLDESVIVAELPDDERGFDLTSRRVRNMSSEYDNTMRKLINSGDIFYDGKKYRLIEIEDK